jgi:hypothetical protein
MHNHPPSTPAFAHKPEAAPTEYAIKKIVERFQLGREVAREIARLAGVGAGEREAH